MNRGSGSAEGKVIAAQIQENLDPIVTIDEIDGEEFEANPLDSCDAGQLEACAIERCYSQFSTAYAMMKERCLSSVSASHLHRDSS